MDKSGEYYLKNVKMQNRKHDFKFHKKNSLNNPQNLENCLISGTALKIRKRASKIVTLLPENSLTPIPKKEGINKTGFANGYKKKELNDAQRTAVFIRRLEYSTTMKKNLIKEEDDKEEKERKIMFIQEWWKTMFKIIKLQKNVRGFIFRKKLMDNLEHQEKLYQFITEFDNIYNYHLFRQFMDNLKKKRDYEKAKLMEKCEDFGEKLENLEKMNNVKNLRKCINKWQTINKIQKKLALENLTSKLNNLLTIKFNKTKIDTLKKIDNKTKKEEEYLDDKAKKFREKKAKEKFIQNLIRLHKLNKILHKLNNKNNKKKLKEAFDKLKKFKDISKSLEMLKKTVKSNIKKNIMNDLKNIYFIEKINDIIQKYNDKIDSEGKKDFFNNLREKINKQKLKNSLNKWKNISNDLSSKKIILKKLIQYKKDELAKKDEEEKNKITISSNINDIQLIPEKKPELINFTFDNLQEKMPKIEDMDILKRQLNNLILYNNNRKLKKYLDKWRNNIKRKEIKEKLIKYQTRKIAGDKLRSTLNNIQKINNDNKLKEYFDKWKEKSNKIKQHNLEKFLQKLNDILIKAEKESNNKLIKDAFDLFKKNNDIIKSVKILQKFFDIKPKKDAFNTLEKNAGMSEGFRILAKLFNKKENFYKKELYDKLKRNYSIQKASEKLGKLLSDKIKKEILEDLIKLYKQKKGFEILNEFINKKLMKKYYDQLILNNNIQKACEKLEKVVNNKLKEDTWKKLVAMDFADILKDYKNKIDQNKKQKEDKIQDIILNLKKLKQNENNDLLNKYLDKWNEISTRRKIKENLVDKSLKKKALIHWKNIKELRDILEGLKNYALKKKYFNKLKSEVKKKILRNLRKNQLLRNIIKNILNIYKSQENQLLKKYLRKWLSNSKNKEEELENDIPKYRKKPKFKEKEIIIDDDSNEYNPTYYNSKKNIFKQKYIPYKKYPKKENTYIEQSQGFNYIETSEQEAPKIKRNLMKLNRYNFEDNESSSNEDTIHGIGETLIQREKLVGEPRNYTSQSFFIDKNLQNNLINSKNYDINSYNKKILPMTMKGDFLSLIEQNPKILEQKNPRIQVTNATCDLDQIIDSENTDNELNPEEINDEIEKLNNNFIVDENKVLSKVIKNCDKDLYAAQKPFRTKKNHWYSVGIPLNNNEAKWEFLNNIRGEKGKNDTNKFELIQKEGEPIKEDVNYNKRSVLKRNNVFSTKNKDTSFKLREINFLQYYRSPMKSPKNGDNDNKIIRYDRLRRQQKKLNPHTLFVKSSEKKRKMKNKYNIDRSHGKIELNPKIRTIGYDNYNDDSDENNY